MKLILEMFECIGKGVAIASIAILSLLVLVSIFGLLEMFMEGLI